MPVISFANMKGGVGKTTLCVNLAFELFQRGNKVLLVDNDPQFNASTALLKPQQYINSVIKDGSKSIYDIYEHPPRTLKKKKKKIEPQKYFIRTWYKVTNPDIRLDLLPSRIELYETLRNPSHKEYLLDKFLNTYAKDYDYIFIDCPPTPSILTLSAFAASDYVLIPVKPDYFATLGLPQFLGTLDQFKSDLHDQHDIKPLGIVFTDVPRAITPDEQDAMDRVILEISNLDEEIPIFESTLSHLKVFQKTLWQAVPVQRISGRGTKGKTLASGELYSIAMEAKQLIKQMDDDEE